MYVNVMVISCVNLDDFDWLCYSIDTTVNFIVSILMCGILYR